MKNETKDIENEILIQEEKLSEVRQRMAELKENIYNLNLKLKRVKHESICLLCGIRMIDLDLEIGVHESCFLQRKEVILERRERKIKLDKQFETWRDKRNDNFITGDNLLRTVFSEELNRHLVTEIFSELQIIKLIDQVLELPRYQALILYYRFGLEVGMEPLTLEKTGHIFDVTRERIRHLESKSLRMLRHPSRANKILL